jgi:cytidylate kinase
LKKIRIAIDGHSSCGKSTIAKEIAKELGYIYVDSGAMYRAATLYFLRKNIDPNSDSDIENELDQIHIEFFQRDGNDLPIIHLNGEEVESEIRNLHISNNVSFYSKNEKLREKLVSIQQEIGKDGGIVMDGRDIGSKVFPNAELKIFMTASPETRAQRRFDELNAKGESVNFSDILENVITRDKEDTNRTVSPLIQVPDAVLLDNSNLTREEQLKEVLQLVEEKLK